jgi:hypothetical protein
MDNQFFKVKISLDGKSDIGLAKFEVQKWAPTTFYATWSVIGSDNKSVAGTSKNYFFGDIDRDNVDVAELIKNDIITYRIGRILPFEVI